MPDDLVPEAYKLHPIDSGDPQRMIDYFAGRHDEREFGDGARAQAELDELAALQRAAVHNVHRAAGMPVREPLVLELTPEQMARVHADRDRVRGEAFRAGLRVGKSGSSYVGSPDTPSAMGVAS